MIPDPDFGITLAPSLDLAGSLDSFSLSSDFEIHVLYAHTF
jgi:hypothetical protein